MKKILFVEDEETIRELVCEYLTTVGFEVVVADEGGAGLKRLSEQKFDIVLTDINMPHGMGGLEFIKNIHQQQLSMPIIAMSGYLKNSEAIKALPKEVPLMEKPVNLKSLIQKINENINQGAT